MDRATVIKNIQLNPELKLICLNQVNLRFTKHATVRAAEKRIKLSDSILIEKGTVVEAEYSVLTGRCVKLIVRLPYNNYKDIIYCLVPGDSVQNRELTVKTVWLNNINDNHATLQLLNK